MVVSKENVRFREEPPDLEVRVVSNIKSLGTWLRLSEKGYGLEPGSFRPLVTKQTFEFPSATYFLGLNNGKPVSTSMSFISDRIVGIYFVSTIPEARGKGFGEALTAAAIKHGFENGCTISSLQVQKVFQFTSECDFAGSMTMGFGLLKTDSIFNHFNIVLINSFMS